MDTKTGIEKIKSFFKKKDRKLLEKYGIVVPDSPNGHDENGLSQEELTTEGGQFLRMILWTENRAKAVEMLTTIDADEKRRKKDEDDDKE